MLGLKLINVSKMGPRCLQQGNINTALYQLQALYYKLIYNNFVVSLYGEFHILHQLRYVHY